MTGPWSSSSAAVVALRSRPPALAARLDDHLDGAVLVRLASVEGPGGIGRNPGPIIWPLLEVMAGIDVLVGSGGYNTVHEARTTATPLVALARPRKYDRQDLRLSRDESASDEADVLHRVAEHLARRSVDARVIPTYENGVHAAVALIEQLTDGLER